MRKLEHNPRTPLLALLRSMTDAQRHSLAANAGTTLSYLYALASCQRCSCSASRALAIEKASEDMCRLTGGKTPVVTMKELATMCAVRPD